MKEINVSEIVTFLGPALKDVFGSTEKFVDNVSDGSTTNTMTLDWVNSRKINKQEIAESSVAKVLVVDSEVNYSDVIKSQDKTLIVVDNPRVEMSKIIATFFEEKRTSYIHPSAIIHPQADIHPTVYIDAGCIIGKVVIGKNTVLRGNVTIYDNVIIGSDCLIQAGVVIGTDGLGCSREPDGTLIKFPHIGGVIIGDNVEIGANCQIARGALSNTIIGNGCKLNGLCFVAHNCRLGKNVWITGSSMLAGSVVVEDNVTIFSRVTIREQRKIGFGAIIGMGSVVTKDIPAGETWIGCPAKKMEK